MDRTSDPNTLRDRLKEVVTKAASGKKRPAVAAPIVKIKKLVQVPWKPESVAPVLQKGYNTIVKIEGDYVTLCKGESQVKEVDSQKRITIKSANDVYKAPSGVPQVQRGTIPSSNNPGNLICTQNLEGVTSAKLQAITEHAQANQLEGAFPHSGRSTVTCSAKFVGASSSNANNQASVQYPSCDGDLHENSQGLVASHMQELSDLFATREKDNEEILALIQCEVDLLNQSC